MTSKQKAFLWFDPEGDHVEIAFGPRKGIGDIMHTDDERIVLRLNDAGELIGIVLHSVSSFLQGDKPYDMEAVPRKGGPPRPAGRGHAQ